MTATPERSIVATLRTALAPVAVHWGFAPFEDVAAVPSLPLVVVQRMTYSTGNYEDMCTDAAYFGDAILMLHTWALGYEDARALSAAVRSAMMASVAGWRLQTENDIFEPTFRAWRIEGQWLGAGIAPD